jgi:hypothetical protein
MPNTLGGYSLTQFAQEALIQLETQLGIAGRVYRGYDKNPQQKGAVIQLRRPSAFTAQNAPSSPQDAAADLVNITLSNWKDVVFQLTDKDLDASLDTIVQDHIRPAAYALALNVDQSLAELYKKIPWAYDWNASTLINNLTQPQRMLADLGAPVDDGMVYMALNNISYADLLAQDFIYAVDRTGQNAALRTGIIQPAFGVGVHRSGVLRTHASGTVVSGGSDVVGSTTASAAVGATSVAVTGFAASGTFKAGDTIVFAGHSQRYSIQADVTLNGSGAGTLSIFPALKAAVANSEVITAENGTTAGNNAEAYAAQMFYHRNAFAVGTAALQGQLSSDQARRQGIEVVVVTDDETSLSLRAMLWYDPDAKALKVSLDLLYGVEVLDPNLACLVRR